MSDMPPELLEALGRGNVVLFWGGDLPAAVSGVPSRHDLAAALATQLNSSGAKRTLEAVAQVMVDRRGGFVRELNEFVRRRLDESGGPAAVHQIAARLPVRDVILTAYDGLLEDAFRAAGRAATTVISGVNEENLQFLDADRPTLIWLYGRVREPASLVLTRDSHLGLLREARHAALLTYVRNLLQTRTVLFVGYDLSDLDFERLYTDILAQSGDLSRRAYAVQAGLDADQRLTWARRNVELVDVEPVVFLEALAAGSALPETTTPAKRAADADVTPPNSATLRRLLSDALTEAQLNALIYDRYRGVYDDLGQNQNRAARVHALLEYVERQRLVPDLLAQVRGLNPRAYADVVGGGD